MHFTITACTAARNSRYSLVCASTATFSRLGIYAPHRRRRSHVFRLPSGVDRVGKRFPSVANHHSILHSRVESHCDDLLRQVLPECDHQDLHAAMPVDEVLDDFRLGIEQCRRRKQQENSADYQRNSLVGIDAITVFSFLADDFFRTLYLNKSSDRDCHACDTSVHAKMSEIECCLVLSGNYRA